MRSIMMLKSKWARVAAIGVMGLALPVLSLAKSVKTTTPGKLHAMTVTSASQKSGKSSVSHAKKATSTAKSASKKSSKLTAKSKATASKKQSAKSGSHAA